MKLKEQAASEISKEKEAQEQGDPCREEKAPPAEAEPFQGEMDNFQTPLVRHGPSAPFFLRILFNCLTATIPLRGVFVLIQLSSLVPLVRLPLFHSFTRRRLMVLPA
jgi:hypothetical protein